MEIKIYVILLENLDKKVDIRFVIVFFCLHKNRLYTLHYGLLILNKQKMLLKNMFEDYHVNNLTNHIKRILNLIIISTI